MQQAISVTPPDQTTLTYGSKNITYVDVSICKLNAYNYYRQRQRQNLKGHDYSFPQNCLQTINKQIPLPQRYWLTNYFDINVTQDFAQPLGNYIVTISNPFYKDYGGSIRYLHSYLTVTNIGAAQKKVELDDYLYDAATPLSENQLNEIKNIYWVNNLKTLAPLAGATVTLYSKDNVVGQAITDDQGIAMIKPSSAPT